MCVWVSASWHVWSVHVWSVHIGTGLAGCGEWTKTGKAYRFTPTLYELVVSKLGLDP